MLNSDIQMFLPREVSDDSTNGGLMSTNQVISGVVQNVWDHVPKAERASGSSKTRKVFIANRNSANESLLNMGILYDGDTLGADHAFFFPVGHADTQADWVASPPTRKYVSGVLKTGVSSAATSITIVLADASQAAHIIDSDLLYITDKSSPDSLTGNVAQRSVSGTPSVSSNEVTVTLDAAIGYAFDATTTKVCVVYEPGVDIEPTLGTITETVAGDGTLDDTLIELGNLGTMTCTLTITFTGSASFTVASDDTEMGTSGVLPSGDINTEYAPTNPDTTTPYITIPLTAWSGTFASGDEIEIPMVAAAVATVQQREVPVSCPSLANNRLRVVTIGESES